jgi:excisionase family DNA binding protein
MEGNSRGLLDYVAAARRLDTSERHIRRLVAERRIPYVKVGKYVRFDPEALDQWVADHTIPAQR